MVTNTKSPGVRSLMEIKSMNLQNSKLKKLDVSPVHLKVKKRRHLKQIKLSLKTTQSRKATKLDEYLEKDLPQQKKPQTRHKNIREYKLSESPLEGWEEEDF